MMSNPPPSLPPQPTRGSALHRRQYSTPVNAFEAMRVSNDMPPQQQQLRPGFPQHRRGMSFDQHRSSIRRQQQQPGGMVSMANLQNHGHQILREAQQQKIARPGQQHHQHHQMHSTSLPVSPQCGFFPPSSQTQSSSSSPPFDSHLAMSSMMQQPSQGMQFASSPFFSSVDLFNGMSMVDENNPHCFPQQVQAMPVDTNAMFDARRMSQPDLRVHAHMRPRTPQDQIQSVNYPLTPPCTQTVRHMQYPRSQQASPSIQSPVPVAMQRGHSLQGIIEHDESREEPPAQRPRPHSMVAASAAQSFDITDLAASTNVSLLPTGQSPVPDPQKDEPLPFFDETGGEGPSQEHADSIDNSTDMPKLESKSVPVLAYSQSCQQSRGSVSPSRPALSPRRMSISDLNLEPGISASIEETNITLDDIAQFIEGPMPEDNKWVCRYEDCNKRFGRKENIKSHVQTHLGDRQFRCDHCKKCFVRGHDLKRHAKIHTGSKPYPCLCGNSFARHDALTRHRQRGMCIGAFEGVVKKVIKRGRPRKHRPEMDDRLDKANRTRAKNDPHSSSHTDAYLSSGSSDGTMSSWGSPPTDNMDNLSLRGESPFDDPVLFGGASSNDLAATINEINSMNNLHGLQGIEMALPPGMFSFTPPTSPGYSTGNVPSPPSQGMTPNSQIDDLVDIRPSTANSGREEASLAAAVTSTSTTPIAEAQFHQALPTSQASLSQAQSQMSHSLPGLSHASSSPAPHLDAFDFPPEMASQQTPSMISTTLLPSKFDEHNDFDTLFDYGLDMNSESFFTNI